jgi:hypothetical protein
LKESSGNQDIPDEKKQNRENGDVDANRGDIQAKVAHAGCDPHVSRCLAEDIGFQHDERDDQAGN